MNFAELRVPWLRQKKHIFFDDILGAWRGIAEVKVQISAPRLRQYRGCTLGFRK